MLDFANGDQEEHQKEIDRSEEKQRQKTDQAGTEAVGKEENRSPQNRGQKNRRPKNITKKAPAKTKKSALQKALARKKTPAKAKPVKAGKPKAKTGTAKPAKKIAKAKTPNAKAPRKDHQSRQQARRRDKDIPLDSLDLSPDVSGLESGDLEGLSNDESADSESVDELLEEGNAFEAGVVWGIEDSRNREGQEVRTREVPEDDVPQEYLDPD